jgi:phosphoglycolate phosphatase
MKTAIDNIIFDLDGTLIDSAPSILAGFSFALESMGVEAQVPLEPTLIGPPLIETLSILSGLTSKTSLDKMAFAFKEYYDSTGYLQSLPYEGVERVLKSLKEDGVSLHLATNKRLTPTLKILECMSWSNLFSSIYTLDMLGRNFKTKGEMLTAQIQDIKINTKQTLYVGDRNEDRLAAQENNLGFVWANWGYDAFNATQPPSHNCPVINSVSDLLIVLKAYP